MKFDVIFFLATIIFCFCSCNTNKSKNTNWSQSLPIISETEGTNEKIEKPKNPMVPMKKVEILVGGCKELCSEPLQAFHNYLSALKNDPTGQEAIKFIDTVSLMYNGEEKGRSWAKMWDDMQAFSRKESINDFAAKMAAWVTKVRSSYELNDAIINGVKVKENWSTRMVIHFTPPQSIDFKEIFVYILKPRGLEWLITEINQ